MGREQERGRALTPEASEGDAGTDAETIAEAAKDATQDAAGAVKTAAGASEFATNNAGAADAANTSRDARGEGRAAAAAATTAGATPAAAATTSATTAAAPPSRAPETRCTYLDCIAGRVGVPGNGDPRKSIFTLLMVGGMVTFMVTYNGLSACGWNQAAFFGTHLWMYPVIFCIALAVRIFIADKVMGVVMPKLVMPHFRGLARNIAATVANLLVMGTVMCIVVTLLLKGMEDGALGFLANVAFSLPRSYLVAGIVSYFIVGPIVKMLLAHVVPLDAGIRLAEWKDRYIVPLLPFFGS